MAEEQNQTICTTGHGHEAVEMEVKDRGLFDFMGKKKKEEEEDEKKCEELLVTEMEKVSVEETKEEGKKVEYEGEKEKDKHGFLEKLHRSHSSSSISSSDEEEDGEGGEKRKKKKALKEKIKEKLHGDNKEEDGEEKKSAEAEVVVEASVVTVDDTSIKVERLDESVKLEETPVEEKKGFLEKIKEKLPGHGQYKKPTAEEAVASSECAVEHGKEHEGEGQKKGFLEKIKEKLPGYHKNGGEECGPAATTKSP